MPACKRRRRILKYKRLGKRRDKHGNILPSDELDIAQVAQDRFMLRKGIKDVKDESVPHRPFLTKLVLKYIDFSLDELIEKGYVYFLNKKLFIEKIPARARKLKEDIKWNGNEYTAFFYDEKDDMKVEYKIGKEHMEKLYNKVKNNWNYYEQIRISSGNN